MTTLLATAAALLLVGSYLVIRAVVEADKEASVPQPLRTTGAAPEHGHRRAA